MRLSPADAELLAARMAAAGVAIELRNELAAVTRAILAMTPPTQVEQLARRVVARTWLDGLETVADRALDELQRDLEHQLVLVGRARAEMLRPPADNRFAEHLVLCACLRTAGEARELDAALHVTEAELRETPPERRPATALRNAGRILAWRGDVPREELVTAAIRVHAVLGEEPDLELAEASARALAQAVATDERRDAVHRALGELREAATGVPLFATALDGLLGRGRTDTAAGDDLWVVTVMGALELC